MTRSDRPHYVRQEEAPGRMHASPRKTMGGYQILEYDLSGVSKVQTPSREGPEREPLSGFCFAYHDAGQVIVDLERGRIA